MPIPYRDQDDLDGFGAAAFLKLAAEADGGGYQGALLQINARGEPLEFTYNRVATPHADGWRVDTLRQRALTRLTVSLLDACCKAPTLFCYLASDVPLALFRQDIVIAIPVCRVLRAAADAEADAGAELFVWEPSAPPATALELRLAHELDARQLLLEPFERASAGLRAVYAQRAEDSA